MSLTSPLSQTPPDVKITWFHQEKEIKQSDLFRMSQFDDSCQLEISRVYHEDEGQYTCVATNGAGKASCSASLTLDGESFFSRVKLEKPFSWPTTCLLAKTLKVRTLFGRPQRA